MKKAHPQTRELNSRESAVAPKGIVLGRLVSVDGVGNVGVDYPGAPRKPGAPNDENYVPALSTVPLSPADIGRRVALAFEDERIDRPIVIGAIHEPLDALIGLKEPSDAEMQLTPDSSPLPQAVVDGDRTVLTAEKEIVLQCGDSSITLRRDGRVLIRGAHIVSRSSGPNRIKGASIQLN